MHLWVHLFFLIGIDDIYPNESNILIIWFKWNFDILILVRCLYMLSLYDAFVECHVE